MLQFVSQIVSPHRAGCLQMPADAPVAEVTPWQIRGDLLIDTVECSTLCTHAGLIIAGNCCLICLLTAVSSEDCRCCRFFTWTSYDFLLERNFSGPKCRSIVGLHFVCHSFVRRSPRLIFHFPTGGSSLIKFVHLAEVCLAEHPNIRAWCSTERQAILQQLYYSIYELLDKKDPMIFQMMCRCPPAPPKNRYIWH